eukprot:8337963-Pyramimonas_sp.AAC.1
MFINKRLTVLRLALQDIGLTVPQITLREAVFASYRVDVIATRLAGALGDPTRAKSLPTSSGFLSMALARVTETEQMSRRQSGRGGGART